MRVEILVLNSDPEVTKQLRVFLERQGHRVHTALAVAEALPLLEAHRADLLLAECRQLEMNGTSLFRFLGRTPRPPLLLPMASTAPVESEASSLPADGQRLEAVIAQVKNLLMEPQAEVLRIGDLMIDLASKRVTIHGQRITLPPIQFRLLSYLVQNSGRVVGARELLKAVWGYEGDEAEARELVKVHVRQIRRRLGLEAQQANYVQSVRGFGYVVTPPGSSTR